MAWTPTRWTRSTDGGPARGRRFSGRSKGREWIEYDVTVRRSGYYKFAARVSSPYSPAGTYRLSFDGGTAGTAVRVRNTTGHSAFFLQSSGTGAYLKAGNHRLRLSMDKDAYQNFNLDYLQLTRAG